MLQSCGTDTPRRQAGGGAYPLMHPPPALFVQAVIDTGCGICAVGHVAYVLGDTDLTPQEQEADRAEAARDQ